MEGSLSQWGESRANISKMTQPNAKMSVFVLQKRMQNNKPENHNAYERLDGEPWSSLFLKGRWQRLFTFLTSKYFCTWWYPRELLPGQTRALFQCTELVDYRLFLPCSPVTDSIENWKYARLWKTKYGLQNIIHRSRKDSGKMGAKRRPRFVR